MTDLTGKTALITGSARGIGKAIALRYAALGANVVINYSGDTANAERTLEEVRALGADAIVIRADASDPHELERLFTESRERFGSIDIVVANAGVELIDTPIADTTEEQFDRLLAINVRGTFFTLQKAAKYVADFGRILYIGSSTTTSPVPGVGAYGSTKTGARYVVEVLALELGHRGVTVNTILPTATESAGVFTELPEGSPMRAMMLTMRPIGGRLGRPEDVADAAEYLAGDLASWISGQHLLVSGGAQQ